MFFGKRELEMLVEKNHADMVQAFHELEERVIALEKFNEDEGKELLEALKENNERERKFTQGVERVLNFSVETTRKKAQQ